LRGSRADEMATIAGERSKVLVRSPGEVSGAAISMRALAHCEVTVLDFVEQATVEGLENCRVFIGPCRGSVFIRNCHGCTFTLTSAQCRALGCFDCTLLLHLQTDPVIEDCEAMYFGPYNGETHPIVEKLYEKAGLRVQGEGKWASVYDFSAPEEGKKHYSLINHREPFVDVKTGSISPLGVFKLRQVFWRFDLDRDGGLSYSEVNAFQNAIGSEDTLPNAEAMRDNFAGVGLELDKNGHLPFLSFLELYQMQGEDNLLQDLAKLGMDQRKIDKFELAAFVGSLGGVTAQTGEDELYMEDDFEEDDSAPNGSGAFHPSERREPEMLRKSDGFSAEALESNRNLFEDEDSGGEAPDDIWGSAIWLCRDAHRRGVDLQKWFAAKDLERKMALPRAVFETTLSSLLLSLCGGAPQDFVAQVERILDPNGLNELCQLLIDHKNPTHVRYMPLVLKSRFTNVQPREAHQSFMSQPNYGEYSGSIEDFLSKEFAEGNRAAIFHRIREALLTWKWSKAGRTPLRSDGAWKTPDEFISVENIRHAFRAALQVDFSGDQIFELLDMIRDNVETEVETRTRTREENAHEDGEELVSVAVLLRWIGTLKLKRAIGRSAWLSEKRAAKRAVLHEKSSLLQKALQGDLDSLETLLKNENDSLRVLLKKTVLLPDWAVDGEALGRARDVVTTSVGKSAVRKRAIHLCNERGGGGDSYKKFIDAAKKQILRERRTLEKELLQFDFDTKVSVLVEFERDLKNGTTAGIFEEWLRQREELRKKRRRLVNRWANQKLVLGSATKDEEEVILAKDFFDKIKSLVGLTFHQQIDGNRGFPVCRSSRYSGLDVDQRIAALKRSKVEQVRMKEGQTSRELVSKLAAVAAGEILISRHEVKDHFGGILQSLLADPKTSTVAMALYDPGITAKHKFDEHIETPFGRNRLNELRERLGEDRAVVALQQELRQNIVQESGFIDESATSEQVVEEASKARRSQAEAKYRKWAREKAKQDRNKARLQKLEDSQREEERKRRKKQSKQAYRQWKRAAKRNQYVTLEKRIEDPDKIVHVMKARNAAHPKGKQKPWVSDFGTSTQL